MRPVIDLAALGTLEFYDVILRHTRDYLYVATVYRAWPEMSNARLEAGVMYLYSGF